MAKLLRLRLPQTVTGRPLEKALDASAGRPRAILVVMLDGMRQNYFERYREVLPTLTRLRRDGAWFSNARVNSPLYLTRRNPMLWAVRALPRAYIRLDLKAADKVGTLFTDGNAASDATRYFSDPSFINEMPWDVIRSRRWTGSRFEDGRRRRCAEVLVPEVVEPKFILDVCCSPLENIEFPLGSRHLRRDDERYLEP